MKNRYIGLLALMMIGFSRPVIAQDSRVQLLDSIFSNRSEVYFSFRISDKEDIHNLTRVISIDNVKGFP